VTYDRTKTLETAQKYAAKGLYDRAIAEFKKVLEANPKDIRTLLKIGDLYTRKGSHDLAIDHYNRVAEQYAQQGFFLKAVAVYKQILKLNPRRTDIGLRLAEMYKQLALVTDALEAYEDVAAQQLESGNHHQALSTMALMVDLDPTNVPVRIKYAEALSQGGSNLAASEQFEAAAQILKEQNRTDDYIKVCERLLFHRTDDLGLAHEIAWLYLKKKQPKAALSKLQACFSKDPHEPRTLELLADAFLQLEQVDKSVSVYRELARAYQQQGKIAERAEILKKILEIDPADEDARQALAGYVPTGFPPVSASLPPLAGSTSNIEDVQDDDVEMLQDDDEVAEFSRSGQMALAGSIPPEVAREAQIARLMTECGVYENYGLKAEVTKQLLRVLDIDPSHLEAREKLKNIYAEAGNTIEAVEQLKQLAKVVEDTDPPQAKRYLQEAASLQPSGQVHRASPAGGLRGLLPADESTEMTKSEAVLTHLRRGLAGASRGPAPPPGKIASTAGLARKGLSGTPVKHAAPSQPLIDDERLRPMTPAEFDALPVSHSPSLPIASEIGMTNTRVEQALDEAEFYLIQGLYDETRQALEDLSKSYPKHPLVLSKLEEARNLASTFEDSTPMVMVDDADQSESLAEKLAEELVDEPKAGSSTQHLNKVLKQFKRGIKEQLSADDSATHFDLGIAYKEMGLFDDAIEEFKLCMRSPERECNASTMIGICYKEKGQLTEAIKNFKRGLHADKKTKEEELGLFYELGLAYEALDDATEALYYYCEVVKRQANFRNAQKKVDELEGKALL
jgi:tetratricopeptide (TPR) repeat protein